MYGKKHLRVLLVLVLVVTAFLVTACGQAAPEPGDTLVDETKQDLIDTYSFVKEVYGATASEPPTEEERAMLNELAMLEKGETPISLGPVPFPMIRYGAVNEVGYELALPSGRPLGEVISPPYAGMMLAEELSHLSHIKSGVQEGSSFEELVAEEIRAGEVSHLYWERVINSGLDHSPAALADGELLPEFTESHKLFMSDREAWEAHVRDLASQEYNPDGSIKAP